MKKTLLLLTTAALLVPGLASAQTAPAAPAPATTPAPATAPAATTPAPMTKTAKTPKATKPLPTKVIHINSATLPDLLALPEVTPKIADNIVKNRPYKNAAELVKKVKGIGNKNVKKILPYIDFQ